MGHCSIRFDSMHWACSNRSAALLKLKKAGKALEDAEECIKQRPEWDKGHYRKALALELTEKYSEVHALDLVLWHNMFGPFTPMAPCRTHGCMPCCPVRCLCDHACMHTSQALPLSTLDISITGPRSDVSLALWTGCSPGKAPPVTNVY